MHKNARLTPHSRAELVRRAERPRRHRDPAHMARHRHQEFLRFLNALEREIPAGKTAHVILDNSASHKTPEVRR